jgi:arylsulfatase A-like enzyme
MDRRRFISLAATSLVANPSLGSVANAAPDPSARPNFLFIIADDLTYRTIHSLNNPEIHTPNLDRLAARGCGFTHCFQQGGWSGAVCIPSRTMLNSGLTSFHADANFTRAQTWGQTMGAAGYDTYICGKWHLNPTALQRSFKEMGPVAPGFLPSGANVTYSDMPNDIDHDYPNPPLRQDPAYFRPRPGDTWNPADRSNYGHWLHMNLIDAASPNRIEHSSAVYADAVIDHLLNKAEKRDAPFFMYLGFNAPHDPRQSPQEFLDLYPREKIEVPPNYIPEHPFSIGPDSVGRDESLAPFPRTREAVQTHRREYYAIISHMDQQIGRILDALEQLGKASNTYVILTADHGLAVGEHGLMGKQNVYDCSMRVPLLITGPGVAPGKRVDELVYQHSMFATTCELAGIPIPAAVEFPSIASLIHGEPHSVHEAIFCWHRHFQRAVRTKTHKLIVYPQVQRIQLFDIEEDPWEIHDLSTDPSTVALKMELMVALRKLQKDLDDPLDLRDPLNGVWPQNQNKPERDSSS